MGLRLLRRLVIVTHFGPSVAVRKEAPEQQLIVITCNDGSTALMQFVTVQPRARMADGQVDPGWTRTPTPQAIAEEIAKSRIDAASWRYGTPDEVPTDRTFRAAWKDGVVNGVGKLDVDMPRARDIWRDKMREARAPKLAALDTDYMRADEAGDSQTKKIIAAQKQILRDITDRPAIEAAQTPEELKAVWPAELV